jgi:hypothetical protein
LTSDRISSIDFPPKWLHIGELRELLEEALILLNNPEIIEQELKLSNNPDFLPGLVPVPRNKKPKTNPLTGQPEPKVDPSERKPKTRAWNPAYGVLERLKRSSNEDCWRIGYEIDIRLEKLEPLYLRAYREFINDPRRKWHFKVAECMESVATGPDRTISRDKATWLTAGDILGYEGGSQSSTTSTDRPRSFHTVDSGVPLLMGRACSAITGLERRNRSIFSRRSSRSSVGHESLPSLCSTTSNQERPIID